MNKTCLIGRLTTKPEIKYTSSNVPFTRFTIAINKNFANQDGSREADFINCIAWEKRAELIYERFNKGSQIGIDGRIQTGSYDTQDGSKRYTTDIVVENITFLDNKKDERPENQYARQTQKEDKDEEYDPYEDFGDKVVIDDNFLD